MPTWPLQTLAAELPAPGPQRATSLAARSAFVPRNGPNVALEAAGSWRSRNRLCPGVTCPGGGRTRLVPFGFHHQFPPPGAQGPLVKTTPLLKSDIQTPR